MIDDSRDLLLLAANSMVLGWLTALLRAAAYALRGLLMHEREYAITASSSKSVYEAVQRRLEEDGGFVSCRRICDGKMRASGVIIGRWLSFVAITKQVTVRHFTVDGIVVWRWRFLPTLVPDDEALAAASRSSSVSTSIQNAGTAMIRSAKPNPSAARSAT